MYRNTRSDIKGIVHKIIKIWWIFAHPYSIQDVDEFITINGSSAVNGCRENESPNSCLKHHNDPQVIRTTSVYTFMFCEVKSCIFVTNKSIFKSLIFDFKPTSHNIASSSTKVILSESGKKSDQNRPEQIRSKQILWCFNQLFGLSFWHPFTAGDSLRSKSCNAKYLQICSNENTNESTSWMALGRVNVQQFYFNFWGELFL